MQELWLLFPFDERYEVSNWGRLRRASNKRIRTCSLKQNGYRGVVLTHPFKKLKAYDLHMMVALTWLGPKPVGHDVSHQDGDRLNNHVSNLRYETRKENAQKYFNKLHSKKGTRITAAQVRRVRKDTSLSNQEWGRKLGLSRKTIWKARNRYTWKHI